MTSILRSIGGATALVREGKLGEATAAIRRALSGGDAEAGPPSMRDVTPTSSALPSGAEREAGGEPAPRARPAGQWFAEPGRPFAGPAARPRKPRIDLSALNGLGRARPSASPALPDGARFEERAHRGAHGTLGYKLYRPTRRVERPALLVMLHGCTQDPDDFALGTGMNALAEETGALIAYPAPGGVAEPEPLLVVVRARPDRPLGRGGADRGGRGRGRGGRGLRPGARVRGGPLGGRRDGGGAGRLARGRVRGGGRALRRAGGRRLRHAGRLRGHGRAGRGGAARRRPADRLPRVGRSHRRARQRRAARHGGARGRRPEAPHPARGGGRTALRARAARTPRGGRGRSSCGGWTASPTPGRGAPRRGPTPIPRGRTRAGR